MKQILFIGLLGFLFSSCGSSTGSDGSSQSGMSVNEAKVNIYYFHGKMRCVTCISLQEVAHEAFLENYADNNDVAFHEIDFSEKKNKDLAEKYEIVFSSLVIANEKGHKDLTDIAFSMVMSDPDSLKLMIAAETNALLKAVK